MSPVYYVNHVAGPDHRQPLPYGRGSKGYLWGFAGPGFQWRMKKLLNFSGAATDDSTPRTSDPRGPFQSKASNSVNFAAGPCANTCTRPSSMFRVQPVSSSFAAATWTKLRKPPP